MLMKDQELLTKEMLISHPILNARVPMEAITNAKVLNVSDNSLDWYANKPTVCSVTRNHFFAP